MSIPPSPRPSTDRYLGEGSTTVAWHRRARRLVPGGTSRLHYLFDPYPIVAHSGSGCRLTDIDGDVRIDCLNNMTALIHGHCDLDVTAAVTAQLGRGISFSEPAEAEVALAEMIAERVPSVERIHFRSSGTEAIMMAIKLARAFTGRDRIAKFEGGYHGYYDYVQMSVLSSPANWGDAQSPRSVPSSGGLSRSVEQDVLTLPFNDPQGVERLLSEHGAGIAALLVEPLSNRSGMALAAPGFFEFLREITRRHGIVLVCDEVIAFRVGSQGAQGRYGISPDLTAFGKIIGGGLPI
ncbi:MAG TPA: aminotransferase class III-fold pyridoxal phosphate-dependent enzyme, partial [Lautropia sp.]|nr:aminotransferase class III-fold pyridoxal phosphate-dependent enzyme [Lautropia sp.]